jgi:hypothetical protein
MSAALIQHTAVEMTPLLYDQRGRIVRTVIMRCSVVSRAGQVLAMGRLLLHTCEDGELRLDLLTDGGRLIEGGIVDAEGNLTAASEELFRQFFQVWGMSDLTLTVTIR